MSRTARGRRAKRLSGDPGFARRMYRTNIRSLKAVRFGEIGATRVLMKQLVGKEDGAEKTALHEIRIQKGGRTSVHSHNWQHQIYVTSGQGTMNVSGRETTLEAGDIL